MNIVKNILRNCVISSLTIYSINLLIINIGYFIPINYFSVLFTSLLGMPGVIVYAILAIKFM